MIYLSLCRLGTYTVTSHPLSTVTETSLPCQAPWDLAGLQEFGLSKTRIRACQGKQHDHGWTDWILQGLERLGAGRESEGQRRDL